MAVMAFGATAILSQNNSVPIAQEQHHHLIIENSYIKAYEVEVPPHESTLQHVHDYDYVYIVFGAADITNAVVGKPVVNTHLDDTAINFAKGPLTHVAGNTGSTPFRNITISLLHRQGEAKIYYPSVKAALDANIKDKQAAESTEVTVLETAEIRVKAIQIGNGPAWTYANSKGPFLIINMEKAKLFDQPGPKEKNAPSFPADLMHWYANDSRAFFPAAFPAGPTLVVLEFKN
jgi:hypothetical protein